jgi:hypothetical protein
MQNVHALLVVCVHIDKLRHNRQSPRGEIHPAGDEPLICELNTKVANCVITSFRDLLKEAGTGEDVR